ncbi:MAG TPA: hypothetical protein VFE62_26100 [Gemmataceae bacterium]|nr:hypothetical protein [Gemmataceae bacterium]
MDLFCPHCAQRVTVPNEKAGQVTACPQCAKPFMTPALAPPPVTSAPPPTDSYGMGPPIAPSPPVTDITAGAAKPSQSTRPSEPPPPPPPPGEYTRSYSGRLTGAWLAYVPTGCMIAIFVLSFFPWHYIDPKGYNLWSLSFTSDGAGQFLAYWILTFLSGFFVVPSMVFDSGLIKAPPQLAPLMTWKNLVAGLFLGLAFLMLCIDYLIQHFADRGNPIAISEKLAIRLHLVAVVASFLMFWLNWRKPENLPAPMMEVRW